ncbi:MAG: putative toxin-antitoxin system toxin component, PIN family [Candidatus Ratteibacteria bacterium]|nr:putative toxin-antitoxin system toxin component, PIN family [Candidatus Ratteibacteria bacterium]
MIPVRPKVVIDTNIFISAMIFKGEANRLVTLWQKGIFHLLMSREVLNEYINVLSYPKFRLTDKEITYIIQVELIPFISPVIVKTNLVVIDTDPSDNKFLSLACDGKADYIVSGDKHLLTLVEFKKIKIVSLKDFLILI